MLKKILGFTGKKAFEILKPKPKINKTKLDTAKSNLAIAIQKNKASEAKLKQTQFEIKNPKFKGKDFTFAKSNKKSESNKEAYKRIQGENTKVFKGMIDDVFKEKKAKGGRVGLKSGTQLSPKQMKIASLAGNKKKIDKPDFKKLRAMKSPMDKAVRKT